MAPRLLVLTMTFAMLASMAAACGGDVESQNAPSLALTATAPMTPTRVVLTAEATRTPTRAAEATATGTARAAATAEPASTPYVDYAATEPATHTPVNGSPVSVEGDVAYGSIPGSGIFVMNADGTNQRALTDASSRDGSPVWSPDGGSIAFVSWRDGVDGLYVMDADGSNVRRVSGVSGGAITWSSDGRQLAVASSHGYAGEYPQIYVVAADGSGEQRLTSHENVPTATLSMGNTWPDWSPDGRQIVFIAEQRDGPSEVHVMDADGSNVRRLTDSPERKINPRWSPDGEHIAFGTDFHSADIWIMRADGSEQRNLTSSPAIEVEWDWSPDGARLAFVRQSDAGIQVLVIDLDSSDEQVLYDSPDHILELSWSPDGSRIAFVYGNPERNSDIFVVNADGSGLTQLTNTPGSEAEPDWSPDGMSIVYAMDLGGEREK